MTLDGIFDHTAGLPDAEVHLHYTELLAEGDAILYGRKTFQLMEYWRQFLQLPSDDSAMNAFAVAINNIPKIVFSHTLKTIDWQTATLADRELKETVLSLRQQDDAPVYVGSRSLILQLMKLDLIDEFQLCVYPVVAGQGKPLFDATCDRTLLSLVKTKVFKGGAIILYYQLNNKG